MPWLYDHEVVCNIFIAEKYYCQQLQMVGVSALLRCKMHRSIKIIGVETGGGGGKWVVFHSMMHCRFFEDPSIAYCSLKSNINSQELIVAIN